MRVKTTEDLKKATKTILDYRGVSNIDMAHYLYYVRKDIGIHGLKYPDVIKYDKSFQLILHFAPSGNLIEDVYDYWNAYHSHTRIAKDNKDGNCNLLHKDMAFFTTPEEAEAYASTFVDTHKDEYYKVLKKLKKEHESEIRTWKSRIKTNVSIIAEIDKKLKENE